MRVALLGSQSLGDSTTPDRNVQILQATLLQLSTVTMRPTVNPVSQSGIVDDTTAAAVVASLDLLTDNLPSSVDIFLQAGLTGGAQTAPAKLIIAEYATYLTIAAQAAILKYGGPQYASTFIPVSVTPWYGTPIGLGVILIGAFFLFKLLHHPAMPAKEGA